MLTVDHPNSVSLSRAKGCLAGQIAGDALGSLVEFETAASIEHRYSGGVRLLCDGGTWDTIAGQPTDDSELALALARSLALLGKYDVEAVAQSYVKWFFSEPFDIGGTIRAALSAAARSAAANGVAAAAQRAANRSSQANGALMRVSPLGILGCQLDPADLAACARADASLTHPHPTCQDSNVVFTAAIAFAIRTCEPPERIYKHALETLKANGIGSAVSRCLHEAASSPPADYETQQGWVLNRLSKRLLSITQCIELGGGRCRYYTARRRYRYERGHRRRALGRGLGSAGGAASMARKHSQLQATESARKCAPAPAKRMLAGRRSDASRKPYRYCGNLRMRRCSACKVLGIVGAFAAHYL